MLELAQAGLVHALHELETGGHGGIFRMQTLVQQDYWWPSLNMFVWQFVAGCAVCQANKINTHSVSVLTPLSSAASRPFQQVSVYLVMDLLLSLGFDLVMVVVDHDLTKGVIISPCHKTIDTTGVAQLFFEKVFLRFGLHDYCISNRGP